MITIKPLKPEYKYLQLLKLIVWYFIKKAEQNKNLNLLQCVRLQLWNVLDMQRYRKFKYSYNVRAHTFVPPYISCIHSLSHSLRIRDKWQLLQRWWYQIVNGKFAIQVDTTVCFSTAICYYAKKQWQCSTSLSSNVISVNICRCQRRNSWTRHFQRGNPRHAVTDEQCKYELELQWKCLWSKCGL